MPIRSRTRHALLLTCLLSLALPAAAQDRDRVATGAEGAPVQVQGRVAVVEPDIELSLMTAGGLEEPRREWSDRARELFPAAVDQALGRYGTVGVVHYLLPDDLPAKSRLGQVVRLNEAVATTIAIHTQPGSELATKGARLDWTLGPGVQELQTATGADYALFFYIRDSYASGGRKAMRVLGLIAGAAMGGVMDIGGGRQVGVATLVDLRTGQVVWFNLVSNQSGDLRDPLGAAQTAEKMLAGFPL
jgi:hypothetical protein